MTTALILYNIPKSGIEPNPGPSSKRHKWVSLITAEINRKDKMQNTTPQYVERGQHLKNIINIDNNIDTCILFVDRWDSLLRVPSSSEP